MGTGTGRLCYPLLRQRILCGATTGSVLRQVEGVPASVGSASTVLAAEIERPSEKAPVFQGSVMV